ncbi:hypothetical protein BU16DRAFT_615860 [Lophium mytilinum]|uniref:Uncharacterized protein n=1 Tax=Lophium mytilinum TaxID=390894 RepID=A0A6A6R4K7_9PEZI|nr:hypothetical protein BU16DRAFT_615860 [Lophium mytilinum]
MSPLISLVYENMTLKHFMLYIVLPTVNWAARRGVRKLVGAEELTALDDQWVAAWVATSFVSAHLGLLGLALEAKIIDILLHSTNFVHRLQLDSNSSLTNDITVVLGNHYLDYMSMATESSSDDLGGFFIYATVEVNPLAVAEAFEVADRDATRRACVDFNDDEPFDSEFKLVKNVSDFIGGPVAAIIRHFRSRYPASCQPDEELFIVIDRPQWPTAPPPELVPDGDNKRRSAYSIHNQDLLLVNNSYNGFPDAMRVDLDRAMGWCEVTDNNGCADWYTWMDRADWSDEKMRQYSDKPEAKFACYNLTGDDHDDKHDELTSILTAINHGLNSRRENYGPRICADAGNGGGDHKTINDLLEAHAQVAQELNVHPDWFAVIEPTSKATNSVKLIYKGVGDATVSIERAGEVLRWLGIGFCRWQEWDELIELEMEWHEDEDQNGYKERDVYGLPYLPITCLLYL